MWLFCTGSSEPTKRTFEAGNRRESSFRRDDGKTEGTGRTSSVRSGRRKSKPCSSRRQVADPSRRTFTVEQ